MFSTECTNFLNQQKQPPEVWPGRKPGTSKISEILEIFFQKFQIWVFDFGCRGKSKTRNNFSEISEISNFSEFSICHFFIFQKKKNFSNILKYRNSRSYMFLKIRVLKNFAIFIEDTCVGVSFLKDWQLIKKKTPKQMLSCEYCDFFKSSFFYRTPPLSTSKSKQFRTWKWTFFLLKRHR